MKKKKGNVVKEYEMDYPKEEKNFYLDMVAHTYNPITCEEE